MGVCMGNICHRKEGGGVVWVVHPGRVVLILRPIMVIM